MDTSEQEAAQNTGTRGAAHSRIRLESPRYLEIARDVASKIADGAYQVGEKIYARSALASQYGVSSETARRAICILDDLGIVSASRGSGVTVVSYEKAVAYIRQYQEFTTINDLRRSLVQSIERQRGEMVQICELLDRLSEKADRFRASNLFVPYQAKLSADSPHLGKTLQDLNFWHNTLATVVAIRREGTLVLSPGPYVTLKSGDVLCYIGNAECVDRVNALLAAHV